MFPQWACGVSGEGGGGQDGVGEVDAALGFAAPDPEPEAQEFGGVFAAVIGRGPWHSPGAPGGGLWGSVGGTGGPGGVGFVQGFNAVVPPGDPVPGGAGGCGGGDGLRAGAVHGARGEDLEVVHGPGELLNQSGEVGGFDVAGHRQRPRRRGRGSVHRGDHRSQSGVGRQNGGAASLCELIPESFHGITLPWGYDILPSLRPSSKKCPQPGYG